MNFDTNNNAPQTAEFKSITTQILTILDNLNATFGKEHMCSISPFETSRFIKQLTNPWRGGKGNEDCLNNVITPTVVTDTEFLQQVFHKLNSDWDDVLISKTISVDKVDEYRATYTTVTESFISGILGDTLPSRRSPITRSQINKLSRGIVDACAAGMRRHNISSGDLEDAIVEILLQDLDVAEDDDFEYRGRRFQHYPMESLLSEPLERPRYVRRSERRHEFTGDRRDESRNGRRR